jgi:hypothetical protein
MGVDVVVLAGRRQSHPRVCARCGTMLCLKTLPNPFQ